MTIVFNNGIIINVPIGTKWRFFNEKNKLIDLSIGIILFNIITIACATVSYVYMDSFLNKFTSGTLSRDFSNNNMIILPLLSLLFQIFTWLLLTKVRKNKEIKYIRIGNITGIVIILLAPTTMATIYNDGIPLFLYIFVLPMLFWKVIIDIFGVKYFTRRNKLE